MIRIDFTSHEPIYLQITRQIRDAIAEGRLRPGDPLPSLRGLAAALQISQGTVGQAYRELVASGAAEVRRGKGTFVADPQVLPRDERLERGEELVEEMLERAHRLGLSAREVRRLLEEKLARGS